MLKLIGHFESRFFTALLECGPGKRVDDGVDAGGLVVSIGNPSCCLVLTFFCCFYVTRTLCLMLCCVYVTSTMTMTISMLPQIAL